MQVRGIDVFTKHAGTQSYEVFARRDGRRFRLGQAFKSRGWSGTYEYGRPTGEHVGIGYGWDYLETRGEVIEQLVRFFEQDTREEG
jgi:hypothetical protein